MSYVTLDASSGEVEATVTTDNEELIELRAKVEELQAKIEKLESHLAVAGERR